MKNVPNRNVGDLARGLSPLSIPGKSVARHLPGIGAALLATVAVNSAVAQVDQTWNTAGPTNVWNLTDLNWGGVAWTQNNNAIFGTTGESVTVNTDAIIFNDMTFNVNGYTITAGTGSLVLANDQASTITVTNASDTATITETIANSANGVSSLTKAGSGTLTLQGATTYTGATNIDAGALNLRNNSHATSGYNVASGAQLKVSGVAIATANASITGTGVNNTGALLLDNTLGTTRFASTSGAVTVSGVNTYIGAVGGNGTLSGANQIGLIAGSGGWTKVGAGELSITGNATVANSYTGTVTVAEGLLTANRNANVLAITGDLVISAGGTYGGSNNSGLISSNSNLTVNGLFYGNNRNTAATVAQTVNSLTGSGTIKSSWQNFAGANTTLTVSSASTDSTFSGRILDDNAVFNLVKAGAGTTLTLSGNNTYDGTTAVNAGTLLVNGNHTGGGAYTVANTGKLGGTGSITAASLTVSAGGKLSAGGDGVLGHNFTLSLAGGMDLSAASNNTGAYIFDLGSTGTSDMITLTTGVLNVGTLDFADFSFNTVAGFGAGTYVLFDAASAITGTIGTAIGTVGGLSATLSIDGATNNVLLTVVPEPNTIALLAAGVGVIGFARRVRRASDSSKS